MSKVQPSEFVAYAIGLCSASVCTSLAREEVATRMNMLHPTGIRSNWEIATEATFAQGTPNPCPCHDHPETHKHYLLHC